MNKNALSTFFLLVSIFYPAELKVINIHKLSEMPAEGWLASLAISRVADKFQLSGGTRFHLCYLCAEGCALLLDVNTPFWIIFRLIYKATVRLEEITCAGVLFAESSSDLCRPVKIQYFFLASEIKIRDLVFFVR